MSGLFKFPSSYVSHDDFEVNKSLGVSGLLRDAEHGQNCKSSPANKTPAILRDDHIVLLAIDALLALRASFQKWRSHRQALRALADFDEQPLRDIGFTRGEALSETSCKLFRHQRSYRALAELDETQLNNLSERGLQVRRVARRAMRHPASK